MKFSKLIAKNILRNKRRTFLTVSSLTVSLFLIITLLTVLTELSRASSNCTIRLLRTLVASAAAASSAAYLRWFKTLSGVSA